ncbi:MAG: hypothetical protein ACREC6_06665, partial [Hyphomicrobiaceae bacterium]
MNGMTAATLLAKAARDIAMDPKRSLAAAKRQRASPTPTAIAVRCNLQLPSCRRWLALQEQKQGNGKTHRRKAAGGV